MGENSNKYKPKLLPTDLQAMKLLEQDRKTRKDYLANPERNKHTREQIEEQSSKAEKLGLGLTLVGSTAGTKQLKSNINLLYGTDALKKLETFNHSIEFLEKYAPLAVGGGTLLLGKSWESKTTGVGLAAGMYASNTVADLASSSLQKLASQYADSEITTVSRIGVEGIVGAIIVPFTAWAASRVGRMMDLKAQEKLIEDQVNDSYNKKYKEYKQSDAYVDSAPPSIAERITSGFQSNVVDKVKALFNLNVEDQPISRKDMDEAVARKVVHGRAF